MTLHGLVSKTEKVPSIEDLFNSTELSFDIESTGLHTYNDVPLGFSVTNNADSAYFCMIEDMQLRQLLNHPGIDYIGHNLKYDRSTLKRAGININNIIDTMIAAHLCEEPRLSLEYLITAKTGRSIRTFTDYTEPILISTPSQLAEHFGSHARAAWILWHGYNDGDVHWEGYEKALKNNIVYDTFFDVEMPLIPVLSDMEYNGVQIDADYIRLLGTYFDNKINILESALHYWGQDESINFNSPEQVAKLFYEKLKIKPNWKMTKGSKSKPPRHMVDGKYLETIKDSHTIIPIYLLYKQYDKLRSTYVNSLLDGLSNGRIYGSFNQTGTRTGRLSSSGPNLQNIPQRREEGRKIRRGFIAPEGTTLVKADADQLELKMMAHWSKDVNMLRAFIEGRDIHLETAIRAYGDPNRRADGKTLNFQCQYLGGKKEHQDAFFGAYPGIKTWSDMAIEEAHYRGYARTLFNRKRTIPELSSFNEKVKEHGEREAISTIIQGSSAEVVKIGMRKVWDDLQGTDIKMVLQVHDEVVFEVPNNLLKEFIPYIKQGLEYRELDLPITYSVSYGQNWTQQVKWKPGDEVSLAASNALLHTE